ncbi:MAG: hypothetical protein ACFFCH_09340, partial [Promethearchaeota archaeon]
MANRSKKSPVDKLEWLENLSMKRHEDHIKRKERLETKAIGLAGVVGTGLALIMAFTPIILSIIPTGSIVILPITGFLILTSLFLFISLFCAIWAAKTTKYYLSPDIADIKDRLEEFSYQLLLEYQIEALSDDIEKNLLIFQQKAKWLRGSFAFT